MIVHKQNKKKFIQFLTISSLFLTLSSCGKSSSESPDTTIKNKIKNAQGMHFEVATNGTNNSSQVDSYQANCQAVKIQNETLFAEEKVQFNHGTKSYT